MPHCYRLALGQHYQSVLCRPDACCVLQLAHAARRLPFLQHCTGATAGSTFTHTLINVCQRQSHAAHVSCPISPSPSPLPQNASTSPFLCQKDTHGVGFIHPSEAIEWPSCPRISHCYRPLADMSSRCPQRCPEGVLTHPEAAA